MTNRKKSRFILTIAVMLLGVFLLSPIMGLANFNVPLSVAEAFNPNSIYLPLILRDSVLPLTIPTATQTLTPTATITQTMTPTQTEPPPTSTPGSNPLTVFGAEMEYIGGGGLDQMAAANMTWVRRNAVIWSSIETTEGTYNWSAMAGLEIELQNASSRGIQVILEVRSTPEWARKIAGTGPTCGPISQVKLPAFGNFMQALVARYSVAPYNVKYWEMWNEPDYASYAGDKIFGCWGDISDAYFGGGYYAEMLKAVYPRVKLADPKAQVVIGGLLLDCDPRPGAGCALVGHSDLPSKFLEGILWNNGGSYFDGVSFHAYDYYGYDLVAQKPIYVNPNWQSAWNTTGPVFIAKAQYIQSLLSQYGVSGKFLMNTESALLCDACVNDATYETTKATYLTQAYAAAIAQGLRANIWYSVAGWRNSGLLNADLSPRPAYTAFKFARSELGEVAFTGVITAADIGSVSGVNGYKFQSGDRRIWVLWSLDGNQHLVSLASTPMAAWDALGNSISPAASMNVTFSPLYLEWNP
jgi:hypothetical protein